jgi:hypothetical protein
MKTFSIADELRTELAQHERDHKDSVNKWEHRAGQTCFAIMAVVLILKYLGVL